MHNRYWMKTEKDQVDFLAPYNGFVGASPSSNSIFSFTHDTLLVICAM